MPLEWTQVPREVMIMEMSANGYSFIVIYDLTFNSLKFQTSLILEFKRSKIRFFFFNMSEFIIFWGQIKKINILIISFKGKYEF